jgi:uncharacterized protein YecT (DUF1311 family)
MFPQAALVKSTSLRTAMPDPAEVLVKISLHQFVCLTVALVASSFPVVAQNLRQNPDPCKNNPNLSQADMNECAGKGLHRAEARLEKVLKDLGISKDSPERKAWENYRDAQLAALYPDLPVEKIIAECGSVYPMCCATLRTKLTEGRIRDLQALISPGEGDACAGYRSANTKHN